MKEVQAKIGNQAYKTVITMGKHVILADEPLALGGQDSAATPADLLVGSLASCTVITLKMYISRKDWDIQEIRVDLNYDLDQRIIARKLTVVGAIDASIKKRLLTIANKCPIHKLLEPVIEIKTTIE